jgi:D-threo-aldose 1-dehydrogenase
MDFGKREIGSTGLKVSELGLGTAAMAGNHRPVSWADASGAIRVGLDAGISFADTAPFYGFGRSERLIGDALREREGWVLSTKAGRLLAPGKGSAAELADWPVALPFHPVYDYSYDAVMRSYEDSLQRLGLDRIDILLMHDIGEITHGAEGNAHHFPIAMSGGYKALDELRRSGDIKAIGMGVNEKEVCLAAMEHGDWDVFLLAGRYTLLEQGPVHDLLPAMAKRGMSIILGGPFNSGILVGGDTWNYAKAPAEIVERVRKISAVCDAHGVPLPAAALQFPLGHPQVSSIIPGPRSAGEMEEILGWWNVDIPAGLWSDLRGEGVLDEGAPLPG